MLEDRLNKALDEAWLKVNDALTTAGDSPEYEMRIRLAAEAVEYSSALFNLANGLDDFDPAIKLEKKADPVALVKNAVEELRKARELKHSTKGAYTNLRSAADQLKLAYLGQTKKTTTKRS